LPVPRAAAADLVPRCEEAGDPRAVAGVMGRSGGEVLKELLGLGDSLDGTLLIYDACARSFHRIRMPRIRTADLRRRRRPTLR